MRCLNLLFAGVLLGVAGCQSVDTRARQHSQLFNQLSATDQARLRSGDVAVGDTPEMVEIALGRPNFDDAIPISNGGERRTWTYTENRHYKESSSVEQIDVTNNRVVIAEVYRRLKVIVAEVVFMDGAVVHVRQPEKEREALAALSRQ